MMSGEYIGYTLQRLLDERGMRPVDLSNGCGVVRAGVTVYTSGRKKMPRLEQAHSFCEEMGMTLDGFWSELEKDWKTESYRRWVKVADMRFGRYAGRDAGESASPSHSSAVAGERLVAGEGVEPPTQGFSVPRFLLTPSRYPILFEIA